jgi:hypothetical protein
MSPLPPMSDVDLLGKARASSISMPRYRTVLSILRCPRSNRTALRLPVRRETGRGKLVTSPFDP